MTRRSFLVYRDRIAPASEIAFLRRQYVGFAELEPTWIGRHVTELSGDLGAPVRLFGGSGPVGLARRGLFRYFGTVPGELRRAGFAHVVHAQFARGGALALPLAQALRAGLVVTLHGGDVAKRKNWTGTVQARRWPGLVDVAQRFVCVSGHVASLAEARGVPAAKLTVLPIGAEMPDTPPQNPLGPPCHLFVGRFVPKKGLTTLALAMRRLRASGDATPLICVGDGPLRPLLEELALEIGGVELPGWQTPQQVRRHMSRAWTLLVPSETAADGDAEGLPSVIPEAMAHGCAVIGSAQGGIAEAITDEETGLLVAERDDAALACAMRRLASEPDLRHRLGQAGFVAAREKLNARHQSAALEKILLDAEKT